MFTSAAAVGGGCHSCIRNFRHHICQKLITVINIDQHLVSLILQWVHGGDMRWKNVARSIIIALVVCTL